MEGGLVLPAQIAKGVGRVLIEPVQVRIPDIELASLHVGPSLEQDTYLLSRLPRQGRRTRSESRLPTSPWHRKTGSCGPRSRSMLHLGDGSEDSRTAHKCLAMLPALGIPECQTRAVDCHTCRCPPASASRRSRPRWNVIVPGPRHSQRTAWPGTARAAGNAPAGLDDSARSQESP